ncbi:MAG: beta-ketoacyl synthase N-terminal-like domain-containing protein [Crocosphaera sp.]|nr:beta-ketoacyl synthase N-terminal-like domain-containing protein [Crocosphaera sp.]
MNNKNNNLNQLSPLQKAALAVKEMRAKLEKIERSQREPIAIVGMGCRFPGGINRPTEFWEALCQGIDAITDIPENRWNVDAYYDNNPDTPGKSYSKRGGFIDKVDEFDGAFFGLSPREINPMDPQQRLLLEVSWEALENAAIAPHTLMGSQSGVFLGISVNEYGHATVGGNPDDIDVYTATGNALSIAAGRLSHYYGFQGPSFVVDTACSSSLVAIHLACQSLRKQECDLAMTGGSFLMLSPNTLVSVAKMKALSPDGYCKTFDGTADGYVRGEGCGLVVLKRLSDAVANGDNILGVIRGTAMNQDGRSSGLTVPNGQAQQACIRAALKDGQVNPSQVHYIETHGTGTSLGDPIEAKALTEVFCGESRETPLNLGSVKTNIGHLEAAAGVASLIKVVLGLKNKQIPPHLHLKQLNPLLEGLPIHIPTQLTSWDVKAGEKRMAGISSFGFSGTNAHLIIEEWNGEKAGGSRQKAGGYFLLPLSAKNSQGLKDLAREYDDFLNNKPNLNLDDLCFTAAVGRDHFNYRLAAVGQSKEQLQQVLRDFLELDESVPICNKPKIAFLFTGQGSQYINMGYELYENYSVFREALNECNSILKSYLDQPLLEVLYERKDQNLLEQTVYTQPALFSLEYALVKLWESWGIEPDIMMGHSVGEYVAACVAKIFSLEDALKLIAYRGRLMNDLPQNGSMVAVLASEKEVKAIINQLNNQVAIAAINGPNSVVISGEKEAVKEMVTKLENEGIETKYLKVSHAFHSPLMEPMLQDFFEVAQEITYHQPQIDIVSNLGETTKNMANAEYWCRHVREGVQFFESIKTLESQDFQLFLEIGATPTLSKMGKRCFDDIGNSVWLTSLHPKQSDQHMILEALKSLYSQGLNIDWYKIYKSKQSEEITYQKISLPNYPFQREKYWHSRGKNQTRDGENITIENQGKIKPDKTINSPLLDRRISSPLEAIQFQSIINLNRLPLVKDHCINGTPLMNLVLYLEIVAEGIKEIWDLPLGYIQDLNIVEALTFPDENSYKIQLILKPQDEKTIKFQIFSQTYESKINWNLHATGIVLLETPEREKKDKKNLNLACINKTNYDTLTKGKFYKNLENKGIVLGASCQQIEQIWRKDREAIVSINPSPPNSYYLPLGEIDAWIQLLLAIFHQDTATYLIIGLESFRSYSFSHFTSQKSYTPNTPHTPLYWGYGQLTDSQDQGGTVFGHLFLYDDDGNLVAEIINAKLKRVKFDQNRHKKHYVSQKTPKITRQQLLKANTAQCQTLIETYIKETLAQSLQISPTQIDSQQPLIDLLDSLMAMELRSYLERDLGLSASLEQLLGDRNIQQLANSLQEQITITQMTASTLETAEEDCEEMTL